MSKYYSSFKIVGEIADMLVLDEPDRRLLIDISIDAPGHDEKSFRKHPSRTTFTVTDPAMIDRLYAEMSIGDVVEALGSFSQSNYVPYRTSYIDTTFIVKDIRVLERKHRAPTSQANSFEGQRV